MNNLGRRLKIIASLVDKKIIADVGCDHGKLAEFLLDNHMVKQVFISDISQPSLSKAINLLSKFSNVKAICCDGLQGYVGEEIDECVISGMGGEEIIKIISNSPIIINSYILSPQHNNIEVKKFMNKIGYMIVYDIIVREKGKFYNIFKCQKSDTIQNLTEYDYMFGRENFSQASNDFGEYIISELNKYKLIEKLAGDKHIVEIDDKIKLLQKAKKEFEKNE